MLRSVAILREQKSLKTCADCGQPSGLLSRAYNRFTQSEVRLCPSCVLWHDLQHRQGQEPQEEDRDRASAWQSLLRGSERRRLRRAC